MIRVYLCAPSEMQEEVKRIERLLEGHKIVHTNRWTKIDLKNSDEKHLRIQAQEDFIDIRDADILFCLNLFSWANRGTGGRHVEVGYAIAIGKPVIIYGDRTNLFHWHPNVTLLESPGDIVKSIRKVYERE